MCVLGLKKRKIDIVLKLEKPYDKWLDMTGNLSKRADCV